MTTPVQNYYGACAPCRSRSVDFLKGVSLPVCAGLQLLIAACFGMGNGQSQTTMDLWFTNRIVTFTNLQGERFAHAEVVEADASQVVFKTNDIFGTVKLTNLSPATLEWIGIPPEQLELAHQLEIQKAQALAHQRAMLQDEQQRLLDSSNLVRLTVESIQLKDYDAIYGPVLFCNVRTATGAATSVFVVGLPQRVTAYFDQRSALESEIAQLSGQIEAETAQLATAEDQAKQAQYQLSQLDTYTPTGAFGDPNFVNAEMAQRNALDLAKSNLTARVNSFGESTNQVAAWHGQLDTAQAELDRLKRNQPSLASVSALPSHFLHNGFTMVICAPPQVERADDSP
jgi:hypothetical protein